MLLYLFEGFEVAVEDLLDTSVYCSVFGLQNLEQIFSIEIPGYLQFQQNIASSDRLQQFIAKFVDGSYFSVLGFVVFLVKDIEKLPFLEISVVDNL